MAIDLLQYDTESLRQFKENLKSRIDIPNDPMASSPEDALERVRLVAEIREYQQKIKERRNENIS